MVVSGNGDGWHGSHECEQSICEYLHQDWLPKRIISVRLIMKNVIPTNAYANRLANTRNNSECWAWIYRRQRLFCNNSTGLEKKKTFSGIFSGKFVISYFSQINSVRQTVCWIWKSSVKMICISTNPSLSIISCRRFNKYFL